MLKKWMKKGKKFVWGEFNLLLIFLFLLFVFRPSNRGNAYLIFWQIIFAGVLVSAVWNYRHHKVMKITSALLAVPAIVLNWMALYYETRLVIGLFLLFTFLFIFLIALSIVSEVVLHARVTLSTLRGVICAYFLLGFSFAFAYSLVEFWIPKSFNSVIPEPLVLVHTHYISELMYFSFVTLLTIGYGDITAVSDPGRTLVIIEGTIGQFYIAILVARLVAVYSLYTGKAHPAPTNVKKNL